MSTVEAKSLVKITINDKELEAAPGSMLIEVADQSDIHIPRFCYHEKLSVAANCRMCLVDVEKAPKPLPACATPVTEGMKVWTNSERALQAQKDTMEFLLINHPLDCPICDQGGECELQDLSMAFGGDSSDYHEMKRVVADKDIGELVQTEMTRCIQCTRCVRFGEEISGMREMGATGRGDRMEIGTYVEKSLKSELSGNIIDICPVGALTAKPSRYHARSWEMIQIPSIATHDCVGSSVRLHSFKQKLVRVVAGNNDEVNECWISDRDRFGYQGIYADDRVKSPMIKINGVWKTVGWNEALEATVSHLQGVNPQDVGVLCSPRATLEEQYLLQKLMRAIGVNNIDHRLRQTDFHDQESMGLYPSLGMKLTDIENLDAVLLIGSNVRNDQPMVNHRIRKAVLKGAEVMAIHPYELEMNYPICIQQVCNPVELVSFLANVVKASYSSSKAKIPAGLSDLLKSVRVNKVAKSMAEKLSSADDAAVFLGSVSQQHPSYSTLRALATALANNTGATIGYLTDSANMSGAYLAGLLPYRKEAGQESDVPGMSTVEMLIKPRKVYVLNDVEIDRDCDNPQQALTAVKQAEHVIAITPYANSTTMEIANVILPSACYAETSGTYVNVEGSWQSFKAAAKSYEDARPAWKILRVLGNLLRVEGFDYVSSTDVRDELKQHCSSLDDVKNSFDINGIYTGSDATTPGRYQRIGSVGEFSCDSLVRRAKALQKSAPEQNVLQVNTTEYQNLTKDMDSDIQIDSLHVKQGEVTISMPCAINDAVPDGCALLFSGTEASSQLGSAFGELEIRI